MTTSKGQGEAVLVPLHYLLLLPVEGRKGRYVYCVRWLVRASASGVLRHFHSTVCLLLLFFTCREKKLVSLLRYMVSKCSEGYCVAVILCLSFLFVSESSARLPAYY